MMSRFPSALRTGRSLWLAATLSALAFWLSPDPAGACAVPVFRYALERWRADNFSLTLFQSAPKDSQVDPLVQALQKAAYERVANFFLTTATVGAPMEKGLAELWSQQKDPSVPWLVVEYPESDQISTPAWSGRVDGEIARQILESPARREVASRLVGGQSAVWVLVESGDAKQDAAAETLLKTELAKLEKEIEVPPVDPADPRTEVNAELKIAFSVLRISRADPAEQFFISMLMGIDPELASQKGPVAFPIFGQGRVVAGFSGKLLSVEAITQTTQYLCGSCSCEIKAQNPGVDLLMAVDWNDAIQDRMIKDPPLPPLVSLASFATPGPQAPTPEPAAKPAPSPATQSPLLRNSAIALILLIVFGVAGTMVLRRKH
jgi:hypothetical protein